MINPEQMFAQPNKDTQNVQHKFVEDLTTGTLIPYSTEEEKQEIIAEMRDRDNKN